MLKLLTEENDRTCRIAAGEFAALWRQITGETPETVFADDGKNDLVVFGSDAYNAFAHARIVAKTIPQFRIASGTDAYHLLSARSGGRNMLFLAGGRPRALLYAVYRFFELRADCRYFWDGDLVPKREKIDLAGMDLAEAPRFRYRGLRYFAHRSLSRYQAEHWDWPEWKREIDWLLKKRLNLFMLRIGIDDLFQKAFPDVVPYPDGYEIAGSKPRSFDDHTLFWKLEYRAELRKKVLAYARERDLLHPEDVGTMTHWYSRTPRTFLDKVKPDFMPQATSGYGEQSGLVWDIRQEKNLDAYWKLTETHIREYGSPELFHTIGLAERRCYADRDSNHQMKLYTYRRIQKKLREHYPNAPLLIGSWDFSMYWTPEEVRELVKELDPERTLIFDYTSDTADELRTFQNWDLCGKFPWIFGIFHAYEPNSEIRGNYAAIARRLPVAAADPMCKGLVFWPENSHADTLMLEFFAANAWDPSPDNVRIDTFLRKFCAKRYLPERADAMLALWQAAMKLVTARYWCASGLREGEFRFLDFCFIPAEFLLRDRPRHLYKEDTGDPWAGVMPDTPLNPYRAEYWYKSLRPAVETAPPLLRKIAEIPLETEHGFLRRDLHDLVRMIGGRVLDFAFCKLGRLLSAWRAGKDVADGIARLFDRILEAEAVYAELLAASDENSLAAALRDLEAKHETNPDFAATLKGNAENDYCRSYVTELFTALYIPELEICRDLWLDAIARGDRDPAFPDDDPRFAEVRDRFYAAPLAELAPDRAAAERKFAEDLRRLAGSAECFLHQ